MAASASVSSVLDFRRLGPARDRPGGRRCASARTHSALRLPVPVPVPVALRLRESESDSESLAAGSLSPGLPSAACHELESESCCYYY